MRRELLLELGVRRKQVGEMGDIGFFRADSIEECQGFVQREMRMVRPRLHAIDSDRTQSAEFLELLVLDEIHIGKVRYVAEAVAEYG